MENIFKEINISRLESVQVKILSTEIIAKIAIKKIKITKRISKIARVRDIWWNYLVHWLYIQELSLKWKVKIGCLAITSKWWVWVSALKLRTLKETRCKIEYSFFSTLATIQLKIDSMCTKWAISMGTLLESMTDMEVIKCQISLWKIYILN